MAMPLIQPSDRFFVAEARGMAGSAIVRASSAAAMAIQPRAESCSLPSRQELDLLDDASCAPLDERAEARCGGASCRHRGRH